MPACEGEGRVEKPSRIKLKMPAGNRGRLPAALLAERRGRHPRRPARRSLRRHPREGARNFSARRRQSFLRPAGVLHPAALGGEVAVPTLEGKANLKVPAGTQSGQVFKLRGKGVLNVNGRHRGDLLARLIVEVPTASTLSSARSWRNSPRSAAKKTRPCTRVRSREAILQVIADCRSDFRLPHASVLHCR